MSHGRIVAGPDITDLAGVPADRRQHERLRERYRWAAQHVTGNVAEVACGTGQGLGLLSERARLVVGADYSVENLAVARRTYGATLPLLRLEAGALPFASASLDAMLLLEALYFLPSDAAFFAEAARCLKPGGVLLISVINRDTIDYNPRPIYHNHYGVRELRSLGEQHGFDTQLFGTVPLHYSWWERALRPVKTVAVRYNLVPSTTRARVALKRLVFGKLTPLPYRVEPGVPGHAVAINQDRPDTAHQVLLCIARRR